MKTTPTRTGLIAMLTLTIAISAVSCASPHAVLLNFAASAAPVVSADLKTISVGYAWEFSAASGLQESGFAVDARLYLILSDGSRKLAAEPVSPIVLTTLNGSGTCTFSTGGIFPSGTYTAEFATIDDSGPSIHESPELAVP